MSKKHQLVPVEQIEKSILTLRGQRVILDAELARIYGVTTARLNQQVRRNHDRFPADFAHQLTRQEVAILMLQTATSRSAHGGRRKSPYVFTEYGAIMAANVLNTPVAINAAILVVRLRAPSRDGQFAPNLPARSTTWSKNTTPSSRSSSMPLGSLWLRH